MKYLIFFITIISLKLYAADNIATPSTYKITMTKAELCTSAACTTSTVLAEKTTTFDIASASAGADVGNWITSFALEVGTTYTHVKATMNTTFTIAGYTTNSNIASDNCVTEASPSTDSAHNTPAIITGSNATTNAEMNYVVPNPVNAENGAVYGDLTGTFSTNGLTKSTDASTMYWIGALPSSYTPTANSSPKFTISFDVTKQLKSTKAGANTCYMWVEPPSVSVTIAE